MDHKGKSGIASDLLDLDKTAIFCIGNAIGNALAMQFSALAQWVSLHYLDIYCHSVSG